MDGLFKFAFWCCVIATGLIALYSFVVAVVIPAVIFVVVMTMITVVPTFVLGVILARETPQQGMINQSPGLLILIVSAALSALWIFAAISQATGVQSLLKGYAIGVMATAGLYALYLTGDFVYRTVHYYRLPNFKTRHQGVDGQIDLDAVIRDAPNRNVVMNQRAFVSQNQALRAAQALNGLKVVAGADPTARPPFLTPVQGRVDAGREFIRAYTSYLRAATDVSMARYEDELYQQLIQQRKP